MSIASVLALILVLAALITLIPFSAAKKKSIVGYKALCSFTPYSTILLVVIAGVVFLIGNLA